MCPVDPRVVAVMPEKPRGGLLYAKAHLAQRKDGRRVSNGKESEHDIRIVEEAPGRRRQVVFHVTLALHEGFPATGLANGRDEIRGTIRGDVGDQTLQVVVVKVGLNFLEGNERHVADNPNDFGDLQTDERHEVVGAIVMIRKGRRGVGRLADQKKRSQFRAGNSEAVIGQFPCAVHETRGHVHQVPESARAQELDPVFEIALAVRHGLPEDGVLPEDVQDAFQRRAKGFVPGRGGRVVEPGGMVEPAKGLCVSAGAVDVLAIGAGVLDVVTDLADNVDALAEVAGAVVKRRVEVGVHAVRLRL